MIVQDLIRDKSAKELVQLALSKCDEAQQAVACYKQDVKRVYENCSLKIAQSHLAIYQQDRDFKVRSILDDVKKLLELAEKRAAEKK